VSRGFNQANKPILGLGARERENGAGEMLGIERSLALLYLSKGPHVAIRPQELRRTQDDSRVGGILGVSTLRTHTFPTGMATNGCHGMIVSPPQRVR
jgi:hypothetical protein